MTRMTQEQAAGKVAILKQCAKDGMTQAQASQHAGVSTAFTSKNAKRFKMEFETSKHSGRKARPRDTTNDVIVKELADCGVTEVGVVQILGVNRWQVYVVKKHLGIKFTDPRLKVIPPAFGDDVDRWQDTCLLLMRKGLSDAYVRRCIGGELSNIGLERTILIQEGALEGQPPKRPAKNTSKIRAAGIPQRGQGAGLSFMRKHRNR